MKDLIELFKEGAQQQYRVAFLDAKDSEGTPIAVTVLVDKSNVKEFFVRRIIRKLKYNV